MKRSAILASLPKLGWVLFQPFLIALAVGAGYGHTLEVPFYLDDHLTIKTHPAVWNLDLKQLWREQPLRFLGYLSLALDYRVHGLEPAGYHLVNIFCHFLTALVLWELVRQLLKTPAGQKAFGPFRDWLPLGAALIFALHPLQTQAVTYISQRFAVLAALFYLLALACYLHLRLACGGRGRLLWGGALAAAAVSALLSKQNAATLPLAVILLELCFFPHARHASWLRWGALAALAVALLLLLGMSYLPWAPLQALDRFTRETDWFSRSQYLAAQVQVLWWYLRLFVWPVGLRLDYAAHQPPAWSEAGVLLAAVGHLALIVLALLGLKRAPWPAFGVLFFYTAHLVESSLLPIRDLIFEHRTYLPNAGLALAFAWLLLAALPALLPQRRLLGPGILAVVLALAEWQTWQRNALWRDPVRFWEDNVRLEPAALRPKLELAREYFDAGRISESLALGRQIAAATPWPPTEHLPQSVVVNLASAYFIAGRHELALRVAEETLSQPLLPQVRKRLLLVRGNVHSAHRQYPQAEEDYRKALALDPQDVGVRLSLGEVLLALGRSAEAEEVYRQVLKTQPENPLARQRLLQLERRQGAGLP